MIIEFMPAWKKVATIIYENAVAKKFWKGYDKGEPLTPEMVGLKLSLIHSEISEALEAMRDDYPVSDKIAPFGNFEEELADAVIRIMDLGHRLEVDVAGAVLAKVEMNAGRPIGHGRAAGV